MDEGTCTYHTNHFLFLFKPLLLFFCNSLRLYCERFEPRSHFISRLSMIVWVNVVLNRTVVYSD